MCRRILNIAVLFFCSLLTSCLGVFYIDLGNHYAWLEHRIIVKIKGETENSLSCDILIRPQVLNYDYDNKFIIAYQVYDGGFAYDSNQIAEEKDSLLIQFAKLKEMKHCYWIINKETGQVMGPMRKSEFDRKCEALHVKAKMRHFHEKKFWEGMSMEDIDPDSTQRKIMDAARDTVTKGNSAQ